MAPITILEGLGGLGEALIVGQNLVPPPIWMEQPAPVLLLTLIVEYTLSSSGPNGSSGSSGSGGHHGKDGNNGVYQILVEEPNFGVLTYLGRYNITVLGCQGLLSDDGIIEPGEVLYMNGLNVVNDGLMPSPNYQDTMATLENTEWVCFDMADATPLIRSIEISQNYTSPTPIRFRIKDFNQTAQNFTFSAVGDVHPILTVTRVNKSFTNEFRLAPQIRYPVEFSVMVGAHAISRIEEAPIVFQLRNVSQRAIGMSTEGPRILRIIFKMLTFEGQELMQFIELDRKNTHVLSTPVLKDIGVLGPLESIYVSGTLKFIKKNIPSYTKFVVRSSLLLGDLYDPNNWEKVKNIQERSFDLQLAEIHPHIPEADFLLVVNCETSREVIEAWINLAKSLGTYLNIWNVSLCGGVSYTYRREEAGSFMDYNGKVIIFLNNSFPDENNLMMRSIQYLGQMEIFNAARYGNVSTYVVGVTPELNIQDLILPFTASTEIKEQKSVKEIIKRKKKNRIIQKIEYAKVAKETEKMSSGAISTDDQKLYFPSEEQKTEIYPQPEYCYNYYDTNDEGMEGECNTKTPKKRNKHSSVYVLKEKIEGENMHLRVFYTSNCCAGRPKEKDMIKKIKKIEKQLNKAYPNERYLFIYDFNPSRLEETFCGSRWDLGSLQIRRGLDRCRPHIVFQEKEVNLMSVITEQDIFNIIKLLPFLKKLNYIYHNLQNPFSRTIIFDAILSDLIDELDIFGKQKWSGSLPKKKLELMMTTLMTLSTFNFEGLCSSHEGKAFLMSLLLRFEFVTRHIPHTCDYCCCNRRGRIVAALVRSKIKYLLREYITRDKKKLNNERRRIKMEYKTLKKGTIISILKNPHSMDTYFDNWMRIQTNIVNIVHLPYPYPSRSNIEELKYCFTDPRTGIANEPGRVEAVQNFYPNCHFDLPI